MKSEGPYKDENLEKSKSKSKSKTGQSELDGPPLSVIEEASFDDISQISKTMNQKF